MLEAGELSLRVYLPYSITPETPLDALAGEAVGSIHLSGTLRFSMASTALAYRLKTSPDRSSATSVVVASGNPVLSLSKLLAVVLPNVGVIPVQAWVGKA